MSPTTLSMDIRPNGLASNLFTSSVQPAPGMLPIEGPGYNFFYNQFSGSDNEVKLAALRYGAIVDRAGRLADAQVAYSYFYSQFSGSDNATKFAAADATCHWINYGRGTVTDLQQVYSYFYSQFSGSDNQIKFAAARLAGIGVGRGLSPTEIMQSYSHAYSQLSGSSNEVKLQAARHAVGDW